MPKNRVYKEVSKTDSKNIYWYKIHDKILKDYTIYLSSKGKLSKIKIICLYLKDIIRKDSHVETLSPLKKL